MDRCIFQSRKPEAENFIDWITKEMLTTIRKYGSYSITRITRDFLESYEDLKNKNAILERLQQETEEMRLFVKRIIGSRTIIDIADVYK